MGLWLHTCIAVLADFIKLPVYFWFCGPDGEGNVQMLFREPFVVTLGLDAAGKPNRLLDVHMIPEPPRHEALALMMQVVESSRWMFGAADPHILSWVEDKPGEYWAKSLKQLPQFSGVAANENGPSVVPRISTDDGSFLLVPANVPFFIKESVQRITRREDLLG